MWLGFTNICLDTESETTRNGDEKHVGILHTYFHEYYNGKAVYWKDNLGDVDVNVIKVYTIVFIGSHDTLT